MSLRAIRVRTETHLPANMIPDGVTRRSQEEVSNSALQRKLLLVIVGYTAPACTVQVLVKKPLRKAVE